MLQTSPKAAFTHAYEIGGRCAEDEVIILDSPGWSVKYAVFVIKGRWPEAESMIKSDLFWFRAYLDYLISDDDCYPRYLPN